MSNKSEDVRAIFSSMKEKRIRFYQSMIEEFNEYDEFSMNIEKVLAYQIILRNQRLDSEEFKKKVLKEIEKMTIEVRITN